jgi:hypothetical protein
MREMREKCESRKPGFVEELRRTAWSIPSRPPGLESACECAPAMPCGGWNPLPPAEGHSDHSRFSE